MATVLVTRRLALTGTAAAMTGAIAPHASAATETIWSGEYWAVKRRKHSPRDVSQAYWYTAVR